MGSPQQPSAQQIDALEKAGQLQQRDEEKSFNVKNGVLTLNTNLPAQAVSLLKLSW